LERNENQVWTLGIDLAGSVLEFFYSKELVSWCMDKCDKNKRIIKLQGESPISLAPSVFKKMLRIPEPTMNFKGDEEKYFLKARNGGWELLQQYLEDPEFFLNYVLMSKEKLEENVELFKIALVERINSLIEYSEMEVEIWLVSYVNKNEDIEDTLHQLLFDFRDLESALFDIKLRQEKCVVPMRDYIENWFKNSLTKIMKPKQEEVVTNYQGIPTKENTRGTSVGK